MLAETIGLHDQGSFQLLAVQGELDCRYGKRDEVPCVEWTWAGDDDGTESNGRGFATLSSEGSLEGRFFFHLGDELAFRAVRMRAKDAVT
jgi:hypothetical protein